MILKKNLPWGQIRGKISLKPEQAMKMLGMKLKTGAKGVYFCKRKGKTVVCNLMPHKKPYSKKALKTQELGRTLFKMANQNLDSIIHPIWDKLAPKSMSGANFFFKVNAKKIGSKLKWNKICLSIGDFKPDDFRAYYCPATKRIIINKLKPHIQTGIAIFDQKEKKLTHFAPKIYKQSKVIIQVKHKGRYLKIHSPLVFIYIKINNLYSNSAVRRVKMCNKFNRKCLAKAMLKQKCNKASYKWAKKYIDASDRQLNGGENG